MKHLYLSILLISLLVPGLYAAEWEVAIKRQADFDSIQEAVSSPLIQSGDTIYVHPGVYVENVWFPAHKIIIVESVQGPENTIIMRPENSTNGPLMTVLVRSESTFKGFSIKENPLNGVTGDDLTLKDIPTRNDRIENTAGITVTGPAHILHNIISGHRFGILQECPSGSKGLVPTVRFNEAFNNDIGISCCETISLVRDNIVHNNSWVGILCGHASIGRVTNNLIYENGTPGREATAGVLCWQSYLLRPELCLAPELTFNTIHNNRGDGIRCIWESGSPNVPVVTGNIISENDGFGIACITNPTHPEDPVIMPKPVVRRCNIWRNNLGPLQNVPRTVRCISADPCLTSGYHLEDYSPCKDLGGLPPTWGSTSETNKADKGFCDIGFHFPMSQLGPSYFTQ